jgi:hypothetical protein
MGARAGHAAAYLRGLPEHHNVAPLSSRPWSYAVDPRRWPRRARINKKLASEIASRWGREVHGGRGAPCGTGFAVAFAQAGARGGGHLPLTIDLIDFAAFADAMRPKMREDDLVFIKKSWHGTPMLLYLWPPGCGCCRARRR